MEFFSRLHIAFPLLALYLVGCAGVDYSDVNAPKDDRDARGLRYYDSSPYLLVQTDNQGGLSSQFMYLPDLSKKRQAHPYSFLASNTTTLNFTNGILTDSSSDADSSVVPVALIKGLETAATAAVKAMTFADEATSTRAPKVYLFKVVKKDGVWGLNGAEGGDVDYGTVPPVKPKTETTTVHK
jgi:hypothetical protein